MLHAELISCPLGLNLVHTLRQKIDFSSTFTLSSSTMASEEDNFDIDIYGDGEGDMGNDGNMDYKPEDEEQDFNVDQNEMPPQEEQVENKQEKQEDSTPAPPQPQAKSEDSLPVLTRVHPVPAKPAPQQGTKRKETSDDRPVEHGATNALMITDLHWWTTEDDIRGWANEAGAEDELREVTFNEHKVNGKSKGFVLKRQRTTCMR